MAWLITGTSSGFGLALAQHVLRQGIPLVSLSRYTTPHESLPTQNLYHIQHDLADPDPFALKRKVHDFFQSHPELHISVLVNNAGITVFHPLETIDHASFSRVMTTNFHSAVWAMQAILPNMRAQPGEKAIVNISSTQGLTSDASEAAYDASKHALEGVSGVLAKEVSEFGIRVIVANLGSFRTGFAAGDKQSKTENFDGWADVYLDPNHSAKQRVDMVHKFASLPKGARGDAAKGAAVVFDAVMNKSSPAYEALRKQRDARGSNPVSFVERLILGSDAMPKLVMQSNAFAQALDACKNVSSTADADDVGEI